MALHNLLKPFIKPKWQHKKPEIRKLGLQLLDIKKPEDAVVIEKLALADEDTGVRRLAVKCLVDLDKLSQVVANDSDEKVCYSAETRYNRLFSGIEKDAPALSDRLARVQLLTDKKLIEYLCMHSVEMELRLAALVYLDKESILGDIAINDPEQQVRIAAVDRVDQQSTLERVLKKVRSKDKKVSKQIKQKLAAIASDQERPLRLKQRAKQCCIELEAMINTRDLGNTGIRIKEIESNWLASKREWEAEIGTSWDGELAKRYIKAHDIAINKLEEFEKHTEELRVLEAARYPLRTEKKALCKVLEDKLLYFKNSDLPVTDIKKQIKLEIESKRINWNSLSGASGQLSRHEEESLNTRFSSACHALDQHIKTVEQQQSLRETLKTLIESTNQQTDNNASVDLKRLKSLETNCDKLKHSVVHVSALIPNSNASDLNSDLDLLTQRIEKLRQRYVKEQQARQQNIEKFKNFVDLLQHALQQGNSQQALKLQRQTQKLLKNMPKQDVQIVRKQGDERRFQTLVKRIDELRDWKRWASTPLKETLVKEMELLVNELNSKQDEIDISQLSAQIRQARDQWKKLGESEPDSAEELWERFNNACNQAYEPCQQHFDKQKHTRQENLIKRQVICNELQQFLSNTDWENLSGDLNGDLHSDLRSDNANLHWKKAERLLRVAQQEWNNAGAIEKKAWSAINKQFHDTMGALRQKTNEERTRNAGLKEGLIQQLKTVIASLEGVTGESPELNEAIEKVKSLQAKWKILGAASHESKLWIQFRASCDVVFDLRQVYFQAKDQEKKENLLAKEAICELIEAISCRIGDALMLSRSEFENAKKTWVNIGPIEKESVNNVNKRYKEALDQYKKMHRQRIADEQKQQLNVLIHKAKLCEEVEYLLDDVIEKKCGIDDALKYLQLIQAKWQESFVFDDKIEQAILIRFQNAIDELIESSRHDSHELPNKRLEAYQHRRQINLKNRQLICIRMEILAGVTSPAECQQARMEYQVAQLADKMKQGDILDKAERQNADSNDALSLLHNWSITGPVSRTELSRLTQRFDSARSIFLQEF